MWQQIPWQARIDRINRIGEQHTQTPSEIRRSQVFNQLNILGIITPIPFAIISISSLDILSFSISLGYIFLYFIQLWLNHKLGYKFARHTYTFQVLLTTFLLSIISPTEGILGRVFFVQCITLLLLFDPKEEEKLFALALLVFGVYLLIDLGVFRLEPPETLKKTITREVIQLANVITSLFFLVGLWYFFQNLKWHQNDLVVAKNEAVLANKLKSEFLSTMSHEIRTPLNAVIGLTSLLEQTKLDQEQTDFVRTVKNSGESLLSVINDVLDYSKVEAGKME